MKLVLVLLFILHLTLPIVSTTKANGFSVDIFSRYSPLSPFYNASMTPSEVLLDAALRSISRNYSLLNLGIGENKAESVLLGQGGVYLAKLFLGTPPAESLVVVDTGSTLTWIQCRPCYKCFPQYAPIFNPRKSSTFQIVPCNSTSCSALTYAASCVKDKCWYKFLYGDGSTTRGEVASEVITIGSKGNTLSTKFTFGCGHNNTGLFTLRETGIMGLGNAPLSFGYQLGSEIGSIFSYCFVPLTSNLTGKLIFGSKSTQPSTGVIYLKFTSRSQRPFYYLTLQAISVDGGTVTSAALGGTKIFVDSGATLCRLEREFYQNLKNKIINLLPYDAMDFPPSPYDLCYHADQVTIDDGPDFVFHFDGGDLLLPVEHMFEMLPDHNALCMLILPSDISILGSLATVNMKVEYNLVQNTISFSSADCAEADRH